MYTWAYEEAKLSLRIQCTNICTHGSVVFRTHSKADVHTSMCTFTPFHRRRLCVLYIVVFFLWQFLFFCHFRECNWTICEFLRAYTVSQWNENLCWWTAARCVWVFESVIFLRNSKIRKIGVNVNNEQFSRLAIFYGISSMKLPFSNIAKGNCESRTEIIFLGFCAI